MQDNILDKSFKLTNSSNLLKYVFASFYLFNGNSFRSKLEVTSLLLSTYR